MMTSLAPATYCLCFCIQLLQQHSCKAQQSVQKMLCTLWLMRMCPSRTHTPAAVSDSETTSCLLRETWKNNNTKYLIHSMLTSSEQSQPTTNQPQQGASFNMQVDPALLIPDADQTQSQLLSPSPPWLNTGSNGIPTLQALQVLSDAQVDGTLTAGGYAILSDERLKENITSAPGEALSKLMRLRPIVYKLVNQHSKEKQLGFSAQQVQSVMPEAVSMLPQSDLLAIKPFPMLVNVAAALQELHKLVQDHSSEMAVMKAEDNALGLQLLQLASTVSDQQPGDIENNPDHSSSTSSCHNSQPPTPEASSASSVGPAIHNSTASSQPLPFGGATDSKAMVQYLMRALQEPNPHLGAKFEKAIGVVGPQLVWECYEAAPKEPGKAYKNFVGRLEQCKLDVRSRYVIS